MFTVLALFLTTLVYSQDFMGIKVDGSKAQIIAAFQAKGFKKLEGDFGKSVIMFQGKIGYKEVEVVTVFTPLTGKCWKFAVYLPQQTSWVSLKSEFYEYVDLFTKKYGKPTTEYNFFISPYYEGDGYELSAVKLDKCRFITIWNETYAVEISEYKQIRITYQNEKNSTLLDRENQQINNNIF
jgi:hypothetical protein